MYSVSNFDENRTVFLMLKSLFTSSAFRIHLCLFAPLCLQYVTWEDLIFFLFLCSEIQVIWAVVIHYPDFLFKDNGQNDVLLCVCISQCIKSTILCD